MKTLTSRLTTALAVLFMVSVSHAAKPCRVGDGEEASLLKCYESEYREKLTENNTRYSDIVNRSKTLLQEASEAERSRQVSAYAELIRKINQTVSGARRTAIQSCVKIASKFQSEETSIVAAVNCRTEHEVKLDKELRQFNFHLQVLANQPNP